jgi:hypothetical protein
MLHYADRYCFDLIIEEVYDRNMTIMSQNTKNPRLT